MKVLLIINECNPEWTSVPLLSYNFFDALSKLVDVTLVTHERNKSALEKVRGKRTIHYISESRIASIFYKHLNRHVFSRWNNWPLHHMLSYPLYAEFNSRVYARYKNAVATGAYDVVHAMTPILPRYPYKISKACGKTPFILGPVNGGLPFPKNFNRVAKKEAAQLNFLRYFSRLLPGYKATYRRAKVVLSGSSYTLELLKDKFSIHPEKLLLFFENGIPSEFFRQRNTEEGQSSERDFSILFVGRLVPYKGADMLLSALGMMDRHVKERLVLTIVGDGPEKNNLKKKAENLNLKNHVHFTGWIDHHKTREYYRKADIFCFPSIREFGGAVVLEAMAAGLPCIVVNHGGISEYITGETGIKIEPISREYIVQGVKEGLRRLMNDPQLYKKLSKNAELRAGEFEWKNKAKQLVTIYRHALA